MRDADAAIGKRHARDACAGAGSARNGDRASRAIHRSPRHPRAAHGCDDYFEVEPLPLVELPGVPGTACEVPLAPGWLEELPEVSVEDEPEDMPDGLLLGLLVEELPEPDVP